MAPQSITCLLQSFPRERIFIFLNTERKEKIVNRKLKMSHMCMAAIFNKLLSNRKSQNSSVHPGAAKKTNRSERDD